MSRRFFTCQLAASLLLLSIALPVRAVTNWQHSPDQADDWWVAQNWDGGVPTSGSTANIANGGTATIASGLANFYYLYLGGDTGTGTVNMTGGSINVSATEIGVTRPGYFVQSGGTHTEAYGWSLNIRNGGKYDLSGTGVLNATDVRVHTGDFTQSGGTHDLTYGGHNGNLMVGMDVGSTGTYSLSGTGRLISARENIGTDGGAGTFTQTGGANTITYSLEIGNGSNTGVYGSGTYDLKGGSLISDHVSVGYSGYSGMAGTGTFLQSGGTSTIGGLYLGETSTYTPNLAFTGICNFSGGSSHVYYAYIGNQGIGNFVQSGGSNTIEDVHLAYYPGSRGTYELNGGTFTTMSFSGGSGTAAFKFGGGTLQAAANLIIDLPITLTGTGGDARVNTAGYTVGLNGALSGPGGLRKLGSNTLTLTAPNSYSGDTMVSAGTLTLASSSALVLAIEEGDNTLIGVASGAKLNLLGGVKLDVRDIVASSESWTLVDNDGTTLYGSSFTMTMLNGTPFTETNDVWTCATAGRRWTFSEATGVLSMVPIPEPSTIVLLGVGAISLFAWRRRTAWCKHWR
jgi:autotransporter-associated beta strand protein